MTSPNNGAMAPVPSNAPSPIDDPLSEESIVFNRLVEQLMDDYTQLKIIFDVYRRELSKRPYGIFRRPTQPEFTEITEAMASAGIKLDLYMLNELYAHYGGELRPFSLDRMNALRSYALEHKIFPAEYGGQPRSHVQWVALDKTERWFSRASLEAIRDQALRRQFGDRYNMLCRAMYHLLRRELGRKPTGDDLRDTITASVATEGKQQEVMSWLEFLIP